MITINANLREPIFLRHAGEENALRVAFDLQEFEAHWPGGVPALLVRRPISSMDTAAYPVPLSVDGRTAFWTVSASDTECSGYGKAQLQWRVGGTLAKSCVYDTVCAPSLIAGDAPPDAPSKAWFEAIQTQIGDLSKLTTKAKENLVAAINEAARTGGGSGGGTIEMRVSGGYIQYSNDGVSWENLIAVSDLKGDKGETGPKGEQGPKGENGSDATVTKEAIESALGFAPIGANDVPIRTVNGATGEVKSTYYVSITQGDGVFAAADKSAQDVYDAYAAGYAVYARVQFQGVAAPFVLPLVAASKSGSAIKLGFGAIGSISRDNPPQYPTVAYTGEAWAAWLGTLARASDIPSIPLSLPNPNALNIKIGDTTTSYDGSEAKTVEIPAANRDDLSLGITGAQVGQIAKITAVDTNGKPTAWEPVDMASGGEREWVEIGEVTTTEDTTEKMIMKFTQDVHGNPLSLKGVLIIGKPIFSDTNKHQCALVCNDNKYGGNANYLLYEQILRNNQTFTVYSEFLRADGLNSVAVTAFNSGNVKQNGGCGTSVNTWSPGNDISLQFPMRGVVFTILDTGLLAGSNFKFWGVNA